MNYLRQKTKKVDVPPEMSIWRLDRILSHLLPGWSRNDVGELILEGGVLIDGKVLKKGTRMIRGGQVLEVDMDRVNAVEKKREKRKMILDYAYSGEPSVVVPESIPLQIVYEDEEILVVDKQAGMVTHPAYANTNGTLANAVCGYFKEKGIPSVKRMGLVSRLDKNVSGLVLIAKTDTALRCLSLQFSSEGINRENINISHKAWKYYRAIVVEVKKGALSRSRLKKGKKVFIEGWIGRSSRDRKKFEFRPYTENTSPRKGEKYAASYMTLISSRNNRHEVKVQLVTGRTHQIRAQFASMELPVEGDSTYGSDGGYMKLRCEKLLFIPCWKYEKKKKGVLGVGEMVVLDDGKGVRMKIEKRENLWKGNNQRQTADMKIR